MSDENTTTTTEETKAPKVELDAAARTFATKEAMDEGQKAALEKGIDPGSVKKFKVTIGGKTAFLLSFNGGEALRLAARCEAFKDVISCEQLDAAPRAPRAPLTPASLLEEAKKLAPNASPETWARVQKALEAAGVKA